MDRFATPRLNATRLAPEDLSDLVELHRDPIGLWALRTHDGTFMGRAALRHVDLGGVPELEVAYSC